MLGQSCLTPGFSTLISNLIFTFSPIKRSKLPPNFPHFDWRYEYCNFNTKYLLFLILLDVGSSNEIYRLVCLPSALEGFTFTEAALFFYNTFDGTVLIGIQEELEDGNVILLNPSHQKILTGRESAFIIAKHERVLRDISQYRGDVHKSNRKMRSGKGKRYDEIELEIITEDEDHFLQRNSLEIIHRAELESGKFPSVYFLLIHFLF